MLNEDNNGFIVFPSESDKISVIDSGKTLVYIVSFDVRNQKKLNFLENVNIFSPGIFISDDVLSRPDMDLTNLSIDSFIEENKEQDNYDSLYFPNYRSEEYWKQQMSINLISSVCVGWIAKTYEFKDDISFWNATFTDLSFEGKNLYYGLKKLHNDKEIRILTFSTN